MRQGCENLNSVAFGNKLYKLIARFSELYFGISPDGSEQLSQPVIREIGQLGHRKENGIVLRPSTCFRTQSRRFRTAMRWPAPQMPSPLDVKNRTILITPARAFSALPQSLSSA